jgi:hypothetical protein
MKKRQVDHVLRAAGRITGEKLFIIIGSQSLHGKHPDVADDILRSFEVDLIAKRDPSRSEWLNVIGQDSHFHEQFGYYADPVDESTAVLPKGWKARLVNLPEGETDGVRGLCLDPHDLAIAKYAAGREKDLVFTRELATRGLVAHDRLKKLLDETPVSQEVRERIRSRIGRDFGAKHELASTSHTSSENLDQIRAEARQEWLKLRQAITKESSDSEIGRSANIPGKHNAKNRGLEFDDDSNE